MTKGGAGSPSEFARRIENLRRKFGVVPGSAEDLLLQHAVSLVEQRPFFAPEKWRALVLALISGLEYSIRDEGQRDSGARK